MEPLVSSQEQMLPIFTFIYYLGKTYVCKQLASVWIFGNEAGRIALTLLLMTIILFN